ncbi:protein of unknown function (plasmid) [Caballeronia sp. S22]
MHPGNRGDSYEYRIAAREARFDILKSGFAIEESQNAGVNLV